MFTVTVSEFTPPLNKGGSGGVDSELFFDVSPETLKNTNLGELKVNDKVNLERALMPTGRFGGHMVTGHVDGVGLIKDKKKDGEYTYFTFGAPPAVLRYLVQKGSVAVDGISLTVIDVTESFFKTAIIPHTLNVTTLGLKGVGEKVNLESDILGKYVGKYLSGRDNNTGLRSKLMEGGFV
ncbi:MAG: riboflavin synthase [Nitrospirae bacterium]|nr:riboflavin synthase [Nitrospirota bacterium]